MGSRVPSHADSFTTAGPPPLPDPMEATCAPPPRAVPWGVIAAPHAVAHATHNVRALRGMTWPARARARAGALASRAGLAPVDGIRCKHGAVRAPPSQYPRHLAPPEVPSQPQRDARWARRWCCALVPVGPEGCRLPLQARRAIAAERLRRAFPADAPAHLPWVAPLQDPSRAVVSRAPPTWGARYPALSAPRLLLPGAIAPLVVVICDSYSIGYYSSV